MQFVPKVHFEQIPNQESHFNQEYQRNLSQHHVQWCRRIFDLYQINPVKVSGGADYLCSQMGNHTIEIVALVSGSRETPGVGALVYAWHFHMNIQRISLGTIYKYVKPLLPYDITFMGDNI